jgi:hypothetical protein
MNLASFQHRALGILRCPLLTPLERGRRGTEHKRLFQIPEDNSTPARQVHSSAMELFQVGVDTSVIALWR